VLKMSGEEAADVRRSGTMRCSQIRKSPSSRSARARKKKVAVRLDRNLSRATRGSPRARVKSEENVTYAGKAHVSSNNAIIL
jgi:hypothetical protein